jgi:hypothetical protein
MALPKNTKLPAEPVNSEQAEALEAERAAQAAQEPATAPLVAPGPSVGELEERAAEAETRADAAENRVAQFEEEMRILKEQIAQLMRAQRAAGVPRATAMEVMPQEGRRGEDPVFEEDEPYGIVVGDPVVGYVQRGHQFARDHKYIATEENRGSPRAFNPRLIGVTKPRPGLQAADPLADFRDDPRRAAQ